MKTTRSLLVVSGDRLFGDAAATASKDWGWDESAFTADGLTAVAMVARRPPDAVLVLGDVPRLAATPLVQQIRRRWPVITVVVMGADAVAGAVSLPPGCTGAEVRDALERGPAEAAAAPAAPSERMSVLAGLTRRQRVVLRLLVEGLDMRAIAAELGVSEHTVRTHMQNLYARLGCHSRLELVRLATEQGLISGGAEPPSAR